MGGFLVIDLATGRGAGLRFLEHILDSLLSTLRMVFGGGTGYGDDWLYWGLLMKDRSGLVKDNKFHAGNGGDGKHYWLTPPEVLEPLQLEFKFDCDPCPFPKPDDYDGLTCEWGKSAYVNPPFGSVMHQGKKKGPTAWARKAIKEHEKGKTVVMVYPIDKWVLMLLAAGATVRNLGDIKWLATEDGSQGKGTGRHIAAFILQK